MIYEHVSYFMPSSLVRAFNAAGFAVCRVASGFDDQYLWIEARVGGEASANGVSLPRPPDWLYNTFDRRLPERVEQWRQRIGELRSNRDVVIWGAGAKGVMFLNLLRLRAGEGIDRVVDINPRKHAILYR